MKKIISLIVILSLMTLMFPINVLADDGLVGSENVYIDGVEFSVTTDANMNTTVATVGLEENSELTINSKGVGTVELAGESETYDVKIYNLSEEDVTAVVKEDGAVVDVVTESDVEETVADETYEGQVALAIPLVPVITTATLIAALIFVGKAVIVAGTAYYALTYVMDKVRQAPNNYYSAHLIPGKNVFVNPLAISYTTAVSRIRAGLNTYTFTAYNARRVVVSTGLGVTAAEHHSSRTGFQYWHYHTATRNGAHSFYGGVTI